MARTHEDTGSLFANLAHFLSLCDCVEETHGHLSLREAANQLNVSTTKILAVLSQLQQKYGLSLVEFPDAKGGITQLTSAGEQLRREAKDLFEHAEHRPLNRRTFAIGGTPFLVDHLLASLNPMYLRRPEDKFPPFRLREYARTDEAVAELSSGGLDLVLGWRPATGADSTEAIDLGRKLEFDPLGTFATALIFHRSHDFFAKYVERGERWNDATVLGELCNERVFVAPTGSQHFGVLRSLPLPDRSAGGDRIPVRLGCEEIINQVRMGLGVGLVPHLKWVFKPYETAAILFAKPVNSLGRIEIGIYRRRSTQKNDPLERHYRTIRDALQSRIEDLNAGETQPIPATLDSDRLLQAITKFRFAYFVNVPTVGQDLPGWWEAAIEWPGKSQKKNGGEFTLRTSIRNHVYDASFKLVASRLFVVWGEERVNPGETRPPFPFSASVNPAEPKAEVWVGTWCGPDRKGVNVVSPFLVSKHKLELKEIRDEYRKAAPCVLPNAELAHFATGELTR